MCCSPLIDKSREVMYFDVDRRLIYKSLVVRMCNTPSQLSLQNFSCSKCKAIRYLSAAEVAFFTPLDIPAKMQWKHNDECAERHKHVRIAWRQCNTKDTLGTIQPRKRRWAITNEPKIRTVSSQCTTRVEGLASTRTVTTLWSEPHGKEEGEEEERKKEKAMFGGSAPFIPGRYDHDALETEVELREWLTGAKLCRQKLACNLWSMSWLCHFDKWPI